MVGFLVSGSGFRVFKYKSFECGVNLFDIFPVKVKYFYKYLQCIVSDFFFFFRAVLEVIIFLVFLEKVEVFSLELLHIHKVEFNSFLEDIIFFIDKVDILALGVE